MLNTTFSVICSTFSSPDSLNFVRDGANQRIRTLHTMWEKLTLLYNTLTSIFKFSQDHKAPSKRLSHSRAQKDHKQLVW